MEESLEEIFTACEGLAFTIRAGGLHTIDTLERELEAVDRWLESARRVRERHA